MIIQQRISFKQQKVMIVFQVSKYPVIGDNFQYDGSTYQLITNPKDTGWQSGAYSAQARFTDATICIEKTFFFVLL